MISMKEYERLKKQEEEAARERDQAIGAKETYLKQLKEEFGCKTVEDATALLLKKEKELSKLKRTIEKKLEAFDEKHGAED
jgi:hypothetical protein